MSDRMPTHPAGSIDQGPGVPPGEAMEGGYAGPALAGRSANVDRFVVLSVGNAELICYRAVDGPESPEIRVSMPRKLWRLASHYPDISSVTPSLTNLQEMTVSHGTDEEVWRIHHAYQANDWLVAAHVGPIGSHPSGFNMEWLDLNIDARAWRLSETS